MLRLLSLLLFAVTAAAAFQIHPSSTSVVRQTRRIPIVAPLDMFNAGNDGSEKDAAPALQVTEDTKPQREDASEAPKVKAVYKNMARGGKMEEVEWVDPAMYANTNPFEMSWWAYILFGFPFMLLANDVLHFLPTEGPLAFLAKI